MTDDPVPAETRDDGEDIAVKTLAPEREVSITFPVPLPARRRPGALRLVSSPLRMLPKFFIIGSSRSGTTGLYRYLGWHPSVVRAFGKEIYFFDLNYRRGMSWYRSHFPTKLRARTIVGRGRSAITGEATPNYLDDPRVPPRLRAKLPDAKLIVLLRNPADRAYSHYQHNRQKGVEPLSFEQAIDSEGERLDGEFERMLRDEDYISLPYLRGSYFHRGVYLKHLRPWLDSFPREQLLVLLTEDFKSHPEEVYGQVLSFLGLSPWRLPEYPFVNAARYEPMKAAIRRDLLERYRPHNRELSGSLGIQLDWDR